MTAPPILYAKAKPNGAMGDWHDATSSFATAQYGRDMFRYVRDDPEALVQSAHVQALIAAAVEEACGSLSIDEANGDLSPGAAQWARDTIRALTPADAKAALDRMLQEARRDEREKALREALEAAYAADSLELALHGAREIAHRIENLIQEPPR